MSECVARFHFPCLLLHKGAFYVSNSPFLEPSIFPPSSSFPYLLFPLPRTASGPSVAKPVLMEPRTSRRTLVKGISRAISTVNGPTTIGTFECYWIDCGAPCQHRIVESQECQAVKTKCCS